MKKKIINVILPAFKVPSTVTVVSSGATTIINFGSAGSFTFNPLANWPLVVLQGSAVLVQTLLINTNKDSYSKMDNLILMKNVWWLSNVLAFMFKEFLGY
jgi:hypothetical protein